MNPIRMSFSASPVIALAIAALLSPPAAGQDQELSPALADALADWRGAQGQPWQIHADPETGQARFVFGFSAPATLAPRSDAEFVEAALGWIDATRPLTGLDLDTLAGGETHHLALGRAQTSDKVTVEFRQQVAGVPVVRGFANVLFDARSGNLLSVDTTGLPRLSGFDVEPSNTARAAQDFALATFAAETGKPVTELGVPELVIAQHLAAGSRVPALAWAVDVWSRTSGEIESGTRYFVAADGALAEVGREGLVHEFDVFGTARMMATPGVYPDQATNPPALHPLSYATVTITGGATTVTDFDGNFSFPGVSSATTGTFKFSGPFVNVVNNGGATYSLNVALLPDVQNDVLLNPAPSELLTAQANPQRNLAEMHDFWTTIDPSGGLFDFVAVCNVNISATCNATYTGSATNYYKSGGGCPNTAYDNVIPHEMGHWYNDKFGSGNGFDGFGEGNSDVWAIYFDDDPIVGHDFFGPGTFVRTGENTKAFCGDANPGCYGETHADGEVLMGALWKVRVHVKEQVGPSGGPICDALFLAWMNAYNDGQIKTIIEEHWLTLDDDDGNLTNGTPHYLAIDQGFLDQGFPGYGLQPVAVSNVLTVEDTLDQAGPYGVRADLLANFAPPIVSATLHYAVSGGAYVPVAMTAGAGATWYATIPGQAAPAKVRYYLAVLDSQGVVTTYPKFAPNAGTLDFDIGAEEVFFSDDFEGAELGWTHGDVGTVADEWHRGPPQGKAGVTGGQQWKDPAVAASGAIAYGLDYLNNGAYQSEANTFLRSPAIDCSSSTGTRLRYQRWLMVGDHANDQATIEIGGVEVWENPAQTIIEKKWKSHEVDISALADGNASVQIEWWLDANGGLEYGGWNVDSVEVLQLVTPTTVCVPTNYGSGLAGGAGVPVIDSAGQALKEGNAAFRVMVKNAAPESVAYFAMGAASTSVPIVGGELLVLPFAIQPIATDIFGQARWDLPVPIDATLDDIPLYFQAFVVDAGAVEGWAITPGLAGAICP
jgi:hypothetical protein